MQGVSNRKHGRYPVSPSEPLWGHVIRVTEEIMYLCTYKLNEVTNPRMPLKARSLKGYYTISISGTNICSIQNIPVFMNTDAIKTLQKLLGEQGYKLKSVPSRKGGLMWVVQIMSWSDIIKVRDSNTVKLQIGV